MKRVLVLFLFLSSSSLYAQYTQPSPDPLGLAKFARTPVNYYTGTPAISVPLTQISGRELNVPIGLSYNASGIKVQEIAGSTGLGWSLMAGGTITRIVRGLPDELTNGYCGSANIGEQAAASHAGDTYTDNVANGTYDGEPDIFYFNFLGTSGKFILDAQGQAFTMPFRDIRISSGICNGSTLEWQIIDENGVVYKFGTDGNSRETTTYYSKADVSQTKSYTSSWHLAQIANANGTDVINITYGKSTSVKSISYYFTEIVDSSPCQSGVNVVRDESTVATTVTRYPTTITTSLGTATLSWSDNREDYRKDGTYLQSIVITNNSGTVISKNRFVYSYFTASESCGCDDAYMCKRLKLDKVYDLAPDPIASFTYNTTVNLPRPDSKNIDDWGYYNSNTVNSWLPVSISNDIIFPEDNHNFPGASREPDANRSKANILVRIDYRGGAYQQFNFEAQNVRIFSSDNFNTLVGGTRIGSIVTNDGNGTSITRSFTYEKSEGSSVSSGLIYYKPIYHAYRLNSHTFKRFSSSFTSTMDINGTQVGYSRVSESISGNGKTVYTFINFDSSVDGGQVFDVYSPAYIPSTTREWERGTLKKMEVFNEAGNPVMKQFNTYNNALSDKRHIKGWVIRSKAYTCDYGYNQGSYDIVSRPFTLTKARTRIYDPSDSTKKITTVEDFVYDAITNQLVKTTRYDENRTNIAYSTLVKYVTHPDYYYATPSGTDCESQLQSCRLDCDDVVNPSNKATCYTNCNSQYTTCVQSQPSTPEAIAINKLKSRHQIAAPIERQQLFYDASVGSKLLATSVNTYEASGTQINLKETYDWSKLISESSYTQSKVLSNGTFEKANPMRKTNTFNTYNSTTGNLTQSTSFDGVVTNYTYDANNLLSGSSWASPNGDNTRSVSSTNAPLIGTTSEVDVNGLTLNNLFDAYGRIKMTKRGNDIVSFTRYNYANESIGFVVTPEVDYVVRNTSVAYAVTDVIASVGGTPTFIWDFGDGVVVDGVSSTNHTYTTTGTYSLKVVGMNPEYGARTVSKTITVVNALSGSLSTDGSSNIDLCSPTSPSLLNFTPVFTGGCGGFTYSWGSKKSTASTWDDPDIICPAMAWNVPTVTGDYNVRCIVKDRCGNQYTLQTTVTIYKSTPNCNQP